MELTMNEIGQLKEGIVLVAVIIAVIIVFQLLGYVDKKSKHSSVNDEITQEELWNPPDKTVDETIIIKPAAAAPKDSVASSGTYYHPLTPDQKRETEKKLKQKEESEKAGW
jgi:hypothetical protein